MHNYRYVIIKLHSLLYALGSTPSQVPDYESPQAERMTLMLKSSDCEPTDRAHSHNNRHRLGQDPQHNILHSLAACGENSNTLQYELAIGSTAVNDYREMWSNEEKKELTRFTSVRIHNHTEHSLTDTGSKQDSDMLQVYDTINPKPTKDRAGDRTVYHQLSRRSRPSYHGKRSLPAYLESTPEYSAQNTRAVESLPVYETPTGLYTKQQKLINRHSTMPSSHKFSTSSCPPLPLVLVGSESIANDHTYAILEQDQLCKSTHAQAKFTEFTSEHAYGVLEEDPTVQLACSQAEILESESEHTYAILEQDQAVLLTSYDEDITMEVDNEHTYAVLEQDQLLSLHITREETQSQLDTLADGKQPTLWNRMSKSHLSQQAEQQHSRSRDVDFEPVQIYSTIGPESSKTRVAETRDASHVKAQGSISIEFDSATSRSTSTSQDATKSKQEHEENEESIK